jgi:hypothetical protein
MENIVTYRVKVFTPNCFLIFRGKKLRTPVECHDVFEKELDVLKAQMKKDSLKYEIIREVDVKEKDVKPLVIEKRDIDIKVEELYNPDIDSNSIMDQLIAEEKASKK